MPDAVILTLLHEALAGTREDVEELLRRLTSVYREGEQPYASEQAVALGFLACAKALREASLMQEIAIREEIQELHKLVADVLGAIERTEEAVRDSRDLLLRRRAEHRRGLPDELAPSRRSRDPEPA